MSFRQLAAQGLEVGQPGIAEYGRLAVDDEVVPRECFDSLCDLVEVIGPIIAAAGIDGDAPMMDMHLRAVAIDLDFVQPSRPVGRTIAQGGIARRDESGKWRCLCAGNDSAGSAVNLTSQRNGTHAHSSELGAAGSIRNLISCWVIRKETPPF